MSAEILTEIEQLAPRFADGKLDSLDPLQRVVSDLLLKSRDRTWLENDADVAGGIAVTRLINLLPDFSRHCPELYGLQRSSDVSGSAAADGCQASAPPAFIERLSDWSISSDPNPQEVSASTSEAQDLAAATTGGISAAASAGDSTAKPAIRPLVQVLLIIRNLLASLATNQDAFLQCGALDAVATIADRLVSSHIVQQTPLPGTTPSGGNPPAAAASITNASAASTTGVPTTATDASSASRSGGDDSSRAASQLARLKVDAGAASTPSAVTATSGPSTCISSPSNPASAPSPPISASASASASSSSSAPSARMLNRPPAIATSAGVASANRRKRSISRKVTGTLSLPLLSPSAASFGAPGAPSPAGGPAALAQGSPMAGAGPGTPMSPMFYSSLLPPASPSVLHLALQLDLPRDHVLALKAVLQVIGNFANAGEVHQTAVWDRCFPGTFSRLATVRSAAVQRALCVALFTCCRSLPKHVDSLGGSMDGVALLAGVLRAQGEVLVGSGSGDVFAALPNSVSSGAGAMDEWLGLLIERLCLRGRYFEPIFKNLPNFSPRPALGHVRGLFCPEQAALLWILWGALHANAKARGIAGIDSPAAANGSGESSSSAASPGSRWHVHGLPDIGPGTLKFLLTTCRNAAAGLAKAREEAESKGLSNGAPPSSSTAYTCLQLALCFSLRCLRILSAKDATAASHPASTVPAAAGQDMGRDSGSQSATAAAGGDAFVAIGGSEIVPLLLDLLQGLGSGGPNGQVKDGQGKRREAYPGCRCDVVSVLANACHGRRVYQDAVRLYTCTGGDAGELVGGNAGADCTSGLLLVVRQITEDSVSSTGSGGDGVSSGAAGVGLNDWVRFAVWSLVGGNEGNRQVLEAAVTEGTVSRDVWETAGLR